MESGFRKAAVIFLAAALAFLYIPAAAGEDTAPAKVYGKGQDNTWLGTDGLSNPDIPADKDVPWSGSYVYFGIYDGNPIRFRYWRRIPQLTHPGKHCSWTATYPCLKNALTTRNLIPIPGMAALFKKH